MIATNHSRLLLKLSQSLPSPRCNCERLAIESPYRFPINSELLSSELSPQNLNRDIILSHHRIMEALLLPPRALRIIHKLSSQFSNLEGS